MLKVARLAKNLFEPDVQLDAVPKTLPMDASYCLHLFLLREKNPVGRRFSWFQPRVSSARPSAESARLLPRARRMRLGLTLSGRSLLSATISKPVQACSSAGLL